MTWVGGHVGLGDNLIDRHTVVLRWVSVIHINSKAECASNGRIAIVAVPRRVHLGGEQVLVEHVVAVDQNSSGSYVVHAIIVLRGCKDRDHIFDGECRAAVTAPIAVIADITTVVRRGRGCR